MSKPEVIFFDVNETLSDMSTMGETFARLGAPAQLAGTWFATLLRDGFALATTGELGRFAEIGSEALRTLLRGLPLECSIDEAVDRVMADFTDLEVHPDVAAGIEGLSDLGVRLVTLSNGSVGVAEGLLERAGVVSQFERLLSAEEAGVWKPSRRAYEYALATCGVDPTEAMLVAVHPWDIHGAARAGLSTAWINRAGSSYPGHFTAPTLEVSSVTDLADRLR